MSNARIFLLSWAALFAALAAWAAVGAFAWTISGKVAARAANEANSEQVSVRQAAALRAHALARETKDARAALDTLAHADVFSVISTIEAAGKDAGVAVEIGQVLSAPGAGGSSPVHALGFVVEARGSFARVFHAAALLGSLPIPSAVERVQLERVLDSAGASDVWRLTTRMRVFTTSDIAS